MASTYGLAQWSGERSPASSVPFDLQKRDAEVKILLGCSEAEIEITEAFLNVGGMGCIVVRRW